MLARALPFALLALALAAPASAEELKIRKEWKGKMTADATKLVGQELVIGNKKGWEKFWKAVRPKEKVPAIDFKKQAVLVLAGPGTTISSLELTGGDVRADAEGTFTGEAVYHAVAFDRKGVKTVRKRALPKEE